MKSTHSLAALIAFAVPILAVAQTPSIFTTGEDQVIKPAWEEFPKLPKNKMMTLSFRNANIDMVLDAFSKASGITIVKDPTLKDPITLTSAKAVKLPQAFEILSAALSLRGFELRKQGSIMIAGAKQQQQPKFDLSQFTRGQNQTTLKYYHIKNANAADVARVINDVFSTQPTNNFNPFGGRGGGNRFAINPQQFNFGNNGQDQPQVKASSDDYSNTVIVNAPDKTQVDVKALVDEIDRPSDSPLVTKTYPLKYANASDLVGEVQNILTAQQPTGRGSTATSPNGTRQNQNPFAQLLRGNAAQPGQSNAVADTRTNSLIVTTTKDNLEIVDKLITGLDQDIEIENSTFVIPLLNARPDDVATLLQQAFGTKQGAGRATTTNTITNSSANRNLSNSGTTNGANNSNNRTVGGNNITPDLTSMNVNLSDPEATAGDLQTQVFFGGGQNRGNQGGANNQTTAFGIGQARGPNGQIINTRDLTGQVTVIPDDNTNSIIVVADPGSLKLIQNIVDQLDKIPEQVMIETIIVEATLTSTDKLGIEWSLAHGKVFGVPGSSGTASTNFGVQSGAATSGGFNYSVTAGNLTAFLNALRQDDQFNVLSTPRIFTSNNVKAEINISQQVPYVLSTRTDTNGNLTYSYGFEDVGIVLTVTPRITANGWITLDVNQSANDLQGFTSFNAPIVNQRQASTSVSIKDGETMILGGIMRKTVTSTVKKIPILGDLPFFGNLFRSKSETDEKTELMILLTPKVVRTAEAARRVLDDQRSDIDQNLLKDLEKQKPKPAPAPVPAKTDPNGGKGN